MKAILLSIRPEWLAKILNREKTIEVRKLFRKDYVGWVYLYCSKNKPYLISKLTRDVCFWEEKQITANDMLNGKVVARFWCDKVDEIKPDDTWTPKLEQEILKGSCLSENELFNYISKNNGEKDNPFFAIHISELEIFDRPRELSEFKRCTEKTCIYGKCHKYMHCLKPLTKAPQNYCYVEE